MEDKRDQVEAWKRNPWSKLPGWGKWTIGVIGFLFVIGIAYGAGAGSSEVEDLKSERDQATRERDGAEAEATALVDRKGEILSQARSNAARIVGSARSEHSEVSQKLERNRNELGAVEGELSEAEASLSGVEHEVQLSSIGDGIWQAETDFIPGTYRTAGANGCYWAKLNSAETFDIADNNNGVGQQVVTIDTPYFQTEGCGTWERIGE